MKKTLVLLVTLVLILTSSLAFAADKPGALEVMGDSFILRPLGFGSLIGGSVLFILSLPIAAISQSVGTTARVFVVEPFKFTFTRPLGEMDSDL